jgi:predicted regulator of Ras-like GTPase activity (Roadblock/LC7/MglB family)
MSRHHPERDQGRSVFADILDDLIRRTPGIVGAVLVDEDGETVDYAGDGAPFQLKVTAAHMQLLRAQVESAMPPPLGRLQQLSIRAASASVVVRTLSDGYALVLLLSRRTLVVSRRALDQAVSALANEAGWAFVATTPRWHEIEIEEARSGLPRPVMLRTNGRWETLIILGTVVGLAHEHGYRVRTASGAELTIVREPTGYWYAEN